MGRSCGVTAPTAITPSMLAGNAGLLFPVSPTAATTNTDWVSEGVAPTEGTPTFGQVKFQPSQLACYMDVTRQTLLQTSFDVEQFLRGDLAANLAIEIDRTVLHGSGSGAEPAGVFNTSGIGDVAGGNLVKLHVAGVSQPVTVTGGSATIIGTQHVYQAPSAPAAKK